MDKERITTRNILRYIVGIIICILCFTPLLFVGEYAFRQGFPFYLSILLYVLLASPSLTAGVFVVLWAVTPLQEDTGYGKLIRKPRTWIVLLGFIDFFMFSFSFLSFIFEILAPNLSFFYRSVILPYLVILFVILLLFRTKLKHKTLPFINRLFNIEE